MLCQFSPQQHRADFPLGLGGCTLGDFPSLAAVCCLSWQSNKGNKPGLRVSLCTFLLCLCINLCRQTNCVQAAAQRVDVVALWRPWKRVGMALAAKKSNFSEHHDLQLRLING